MNAKENETEITNAHSERIPYSNLWAGMGKAVFGGKVRASVHFQKIIKTKSKLTKHLI